jgi:hypothetical protein
MADAKRPERSATEATIRELIPYSGYPLEEGREQMHVDGLNLLLSLVKPWEDLELGYRFREDGTFSNVPVEATYHAKWRSSRQQARNDAEGENR